VHVASDAIVAVWGALSLLVHVTTSPTPAVIVGGSKAKPAIVAATVPASVDGAQAASPVPPLSDAAGSLAAGSLAAGSLAAGALAGAEADVPPEQAETINSRAATTAKGRVRDMWGSSCCRSRGRFLGSVERYARMGPAVS
jgi:hypothetical protein